MTSQSNSILVAGPGELDPQFAAQGVLDIPSGEGSIRAIVADGQGAYLVAVWVSSQCWLYRIFSDGGLDTQYGQNGVSKWSFVPGVDSLPTELIMQPDGKVILLGKVGDDPFKRQTAITRFNVGGSPDLVFGTRVLPDIDMSLPAGCLQADGKILVLVNRLNSSTTEHELVLYRFMSTGDPDGAFGGQGFVNILFNDERSDGKSVAVTDDAKILVGGTVTRDTKTTKAVGRFHSTGALDSSFGRAGYWESASGLAMGKMIVDGDTIICVGNAQVNGSSVAAVSRVTAEGVTDPAFNNGTAATIDIRADFPGLYVICRSVVVQSDKGIVFAGEAGGSIKAYVGRLSAGGAIDSGFGDQGLFQRVEESLVYDVCIQSDRQRLLVASDLGNTSRLPQVLGIRL